MKKVGMGVNKPKSDALELEAKTKMVTDLEKKNTALQKENTALKKAAKAAEKEAE